jgi:hypothetical protein
MARHVFRMKGPPGSSAACLACAAALICGCSHDWDGYDPALTGAGGATSSSATGGQGADGATSATAAGGAGNEGGEAAGGSGGSGGLPTPPCGGTSLLGDDFADPASTAFLFSSPVGGAILNGEAVVVLAEDGSQQWREFGTPRLHDLRNGLVSIEVTEMVDVGTTAFAFIDIGYDDANHVRLFQQNGYLGFATQLDGDWSDTGVAFDPGEHRFWRIRETAGTTFWETSPDGMTWNVGAAQPTSALFPLDLVYVAFGAGADGGEVAPGEAHFDHLNGGMATGAWCKASSLTDDFADPQQARVWSYSYEEQGCTVAETGGQLVVTVANGTAAYCGYYTATAFDLEDDAIAIAVPVTLDPSTDAEAYLVAYNHEGQSATVYQSGGDLRAQHRIDGVYTTVDSVPYDAVDHLWWRLRESAGVLFWEASPDGSRWIAIGEQPTPFDMSMVHFDVGAGAYQPETNPGTAHFDDVGLP